MTSYYRHKATVGSSGKEPGQFSFSGYIRSTSIAVDATYIYVADGGNNRIQKFNNSAPYGFVSTFGTYGSLSGQFSQLRGVVVDATYLYTLEAGNKRIQKFNKTTNAYISELIFETEDFFSGLTADATYLYVLKTFQDPVFGFFYSTVLRVNKDFSSWASLDSNIDSFMSDVSLVGVEFYCTNNGEAEYLKKPSHYDSSLVFINEFGNLVRTDGLCNDGTSLYICETTQNKVRAFTVSTLALDDWFGSAGTLDGQFQEIGKIAYYNNTLYVIDVGNDRVQLITWITATDTNPPTNLALACTTGHGIHLTWDYTSSAGATFEIYRKVGSGSYALDSGSPAGINEADVFNIISGQLYEFKVRAVLGNLDQQESVHITEFCTPQSTICYMAPEDLVAACATGSRIYLFWTDTAIGVDYYEIYRSADGVTYNLDLTIDAGIFEAYSLNILEGQQYWFKIRTKFTSDAVVMSAFSTPVIITCHFGVPQLKIAELYEIELSSEDVLRVTSHDVSLTYGGNSYTAIPITRTASEFHADLQVDKTTITFGLVGVTVGGLSIPQIIDRGFLRKARISIYITKWPTPSSAYLLFSGFVTGVISYNQGVLTLECNSVMDKLHENFPKKVYSETCQHNLYGTGAFACGVNKATYEVLDSVTSSENNYTITAPPFLFSAYAENYWAGGILTFTSGLNNGVSRTIKIHTDGTLVVRLAYPETISAGDTFKVYPGCDKKGTTCETKFSNYVNFFGFEYVPSPETLYSTVI